MMVHVFAIIGLAVLCGAWVALQLAAGEKTPGADGHCGACSHKHDCER
jgi:hypothetical protein